MQRETDRQAAEKRVDRHVGAWNSVVRRDLRLSSHFSTKDTGEQ
jgi:hypothetical protein